MPKSLNIGDLLDLDRMEKNGKTITDYLSSGGVYQDLFHINDGAMEAKYSQGYHHFERQEYPQAIELFTSLTILNPYTKKYWTALAASYMAMEDYAPATLNYELASTLDEKDPEPCFLAAYGYFMLHDYDRAEQALKLCIDVARVSGNQTHRSLEDRANTLLQEIKKSRLGRG